MPKERWAYAEEIESNPKTPLDPSEINAESYQIPVLAVDIGEAESNEDLELLIEDFMKKNPKLKTSIENDNLDIVAKKNKTRWALVIGYGFAALAIGVAGYKLIKKYQKPEVK